MKRRHLAVLTPLANFVVYPTIGLCAELVKRGHRVSYVTNNHYLPLVVEAGAEPVIFNNKPMSEQLREQIKAAHSLPLDDPRARVLQNCMYSYYFSEVEDLLSQVNAFYGENVPDLIIYDRHHIPGRILSKRLSTPVVQISPHPAYYNNLAARLNGVCYNPDLICEWSKVLDEFLSSYGIISSGSVWHVEDLNIHFIPKVFQHHEDWFDERFCFTGALLNRPFHPTWTDKSKGRPIILISGISSMSEIAIDSGYFETFVEALSALPYHCILSIGGVEFSRSLPSNFELNRSASHLEILPHAALSVCHGGVGSTLEAIYHGVPPLMIPLNVACEEIAYRAVELGVGRSLSKDTLSIDNVGNTVNEMMCDASLRDRVRSMQNMFRGSGGSGVGADRIEAYLGNLGR